MRKITAFFMALVLLSGIMTGCGEKTSVADKDVPAAQAESKKEGTPSKSGSTSNEKGLTLEQIKEAAIDAEYNVTDEHQGAFLQDVKAGFTVQIVADDKDIRYSILECASEEAAEKNAKTIDDAGHNIAIINGKILSFYNVEEKDGTGKDILASIVAGKPVEQK
ncbi:hypothetical protein ASZ90_019246 [hydrocarbon metagenome]|uniref:Lipoprotein n=1 Tax=hydrocarbon metagenome TaxID=938273 RepID=A0A0W8E3X1_9ZZZZ